MDDKLNELLKNPSRKMNAQELDLLSAYFRKVMFTILHERGTGHWGGASSAAELVTSLYFNRLNVDPENPADENRDRFILSKGHASVNLYTVLSHRGFFPVDDLHSFRVQGSYLQGHPAMYKIPGVDMSTGALGHGLSIGMGMALASELSNKKYKTYVLTGEGCLNEGSSWEALLGAAKYKPYGLTLMVDYNKVQLDGTEEEILSLAPLKEKLQAFGWNVCPMKLNGNKSEDILKSYEWLDSDENWPKAIVYDTVKGANVSFSEGKNTWHGAPIDDEHYEIGMKDLEKDYQEKEARI